MSVRSTVALSAFQSFADAPSRTAWMPLSERGLAGLHSTYAQEEEVRESASDSRAIAR